MNSSLCHLEREKQSGTLIRLTWRESWAMTITTYYLLFKHFPGVTLRQVLQEEESVQHGQCGVSSRMLRRFTYTCPNINSERFVIVIYDLEIPDDSLNKATQTLFTQKGREIENIPLTKDTIPYVNTFFEQDIRLVMCGARLTLKYRNYQALKNSFGNRKMRLPSEK